MSENFAQQISTVTTSPEYKSGEPLLPTGMTLSGGPEDTQLQPGAAPVVPEAPVVVAAKIKIGDQEFSTPEEAVTYAKLLHAKTEGREEALKEFNKPKEEEKPAEPAFESKIADLIFTNPEQAVKEVYLKAKEDAKKEIFDEYNKMQTAEKASAAQQKQWDSTWTGFYDSNQDLAPVRDIVETVVLPKLWNSIKDLPLDKSLPMVEAETRKLLRMTKEASLPKKELYDGPAMMASSSTNNTPAGKSDATSKMALDFISQVRKHGKR